MNNKTKCVTCKKSKPLTEFNPHLKTIDKLSPNCISCEKDYEEYCRQVDEENRIIMEEFKKSFKEMIDKDAEKVREELEQRDEMIIMNVLEYIQDINKKTPERLIFQLQLLNKDKWKLFIEIIEYLKNTGIIKYNDLLQLLKLECKISLSKNTAPFLFGLLQVLNDFEVIKSYENFSTQKEYLLEVKEVFECYSIDTLENRFCDYITHPKKNNKDAVESSKNYLNYILNEINVNTE